jgi:hypothetical protein
MFGLGWKAVSTHGHFATVTVFPANRIIRHDHWSKSEVAMSADKGSEVE